ncbi:four helix bundle protein [Pedobacter sp. BS3]|uniref:four helix bundle protein n=1 Tax=Pedobacter sp. BS3 TaxID=2567937 RepID=UPI00397BE863
MSFYSLSSSYELETQLLICSRRKYGIQENLHQCLELVVEIQKMLFAFRKSVAEAEQNLVS